MVYFICSVVFFVVVYLVAGYQQANNRMRGGLFGPGVKEAFKEEEKRLEEEEEEKASEIRRKKKINEANQRKLLIEQQLKEAKEAAEKAQREDTENVLPF